MEFSLTGANIVVLAKNHNPSIVTKEWLTDNKIFEENIVNFVHTPIFSTVETNNFNLIVDSDRLQLSIKKVTTSNIRNLPQIIMSYISKLPETPYTAIGFNHIYQIMVRPKRLKEIFSPDDKKFREIFEGDYQIGGIINFKFNDFIVRTNIQSFNAKKIRMVFNFHFGSKDVEEIKKRLIEYSDTIERTKKIIRGLFSG